MTISQKYRNYSLAVLAIVLTVGFVSEYFIYGNTMRHTTDNVLLEYRRGVELAAARSDSVRLIDRLINRARMLTRIENRTDLDHYKTRLYDTMIYNPYAESKILYRAIKFPLKTPDGDYLVRFALPSLERQELSVAIIIASICFFIVFSAASFFGMRYMEHITHPFYELLKQMRNYDIRSPKPQPPVKTEVEELRELNDGLHSMMSRMHHDYDALKELMEYSSHELQTPLAIVGMKIEQLSQLCADNEQQLKYLLEIRNTLQRLSRLNRSVLLISRISSDHFYRQEKIDLQQVFETLATEHEELIEASSLRIGWQGREPFEVNIHPVLAEILVGNLLSNAIKYNRSGGQIGIDSSDGKLSIRNTYSNEIPDGNLFDRYVCSEKHEQASGLGLPIVKEICLHNDMKIAYDISPEHFTISLRRNPSDEAGKQV